MTGLSMTGLSMTGLVICLITFPRITTDARHGDNLIIVSVIETELIA